MPKSSRHKSHRQSKHGLKDIKEYSESEEESKIRVFSKDEDSKIRVSRTPSDKRKDHPNISNGDIVEEYISSKRRREKEKEKDLGSLVSDRWNGGGGSNEAKVQILQIDDERVLKSSKSKVLVDLSEKTSILLDGEKSYKSSKSKLLVDLSEKTPILVDGEKSSKSSKSKVLVDLSEKTSVLVDTEKWSKSKKSGKGYDSGSEKKEESKRKYEKESGRKEKDLKEFKEKARGIERKIAKDSEREVEDEVVDIGDAIIHSIGFGGEGKHSKDTNVWPIQDERKPESEKEPEKQRKNKEAANEKDKYQDDVKGSGGVRVSSRGEPVKDVKYKDEKHTDVSHGDKHREDGDRDPRYKDEKYSDDFDRERKYKDSKYRESSDKVYWHKDDKYREDGDKDKRQRDDKYRDDPDKDKRQRDDKYREDTERDKRLRDDKYREDPDRDKKLRDDKYREGGDRDNKYRDAKYREDADKDYRRRADKYHEDVDRDDRHRDGWYIEERSRDGRIRDEKNWEDAGRDGRRREGKQKDDTVQDKRVRDIKYQDERLIRDVTNDNSDTKRSRDENEAPDFRQKRPTNRDSSPNFDDRGTRYKDDRGKRRTGDKEEYDDVRVRGIKDQHFDTEKKSVSNARVEPLGNRGRSSLRDADMVISPNHGRRGNSPSYRVIKQEETRYRDYMHGGRERREPRDMTPVKEYAGGFGVPNKLSRPTEKSIHRDDGHGDDPSSEKLLKEDSLNTPFQKADKSPSSASNDRRTINRADVGRSLDVEDSGQRSGGSKEVKDYYGRDNSGNRDLPIENLPRDEISQANTDNISVSSPFGKPNYFNNSNRSQLPPTPFRGGPDRPFDDDTRCKQNRRRRMDSNIGRPHQGNAWRGVPNWPSPVANGFVPFQHGPPPLGFHPIMQQFPPAPMFGVRPPMDMNQSGLPFHVHDSDRFGRPLGWDGNNSMFGDESHLYGRLDWDHNRNLNGAQGWENSRDVWKGQNSNFNVDLTAVPHKDDQSAPMPGDEEWLGKTMPPAQPDKKQPSDQVGSVAFDDPSDAVEGDSHKEAPKAIQEDISDPETKGDYFSRAYLSMIDISQKLSECELYSQYTCLMGVDQNADPEEDDLKLLIMEKDIDALGNKTSSASLFGAMNDSVFQRAMSLYKKIEGEVMTIGQDKVLSPTSENTGPVSLVNPVVAASNDEQLMDVIPETTEPKEPEISIAELSKVKIEAGLEIIVDVGKSDQPNAALNDVVKMEIEPVVKKDLSDDIEVNMNSIDSNGNEGQNLNAGKFINLPFSGASTEVEYEGVIESGSLNLSRIHQSPESTH